MRIIIINGDYVDIDHDVDPHQGLLVRPKSHYTDIEGGFMGSFKLKPLALYRYRGQFQ